MNNQLAVLIDANGKTPAERMMQLAEAYKMAQNAQIKAMGLGLDAIRQTWWEFGQKVSGMQKDLLGEHPELIMMPLDTK